MSTVYMFLVLSLYSWVSQGTLSECGLLSKISSSLSDKYFRCSSIQSPDLPDHTPQCKSEEIFLYKIYQVGNIMKAYLRSTLYIHVYIQYNMWTSTLIFGQSVSSCPYKWFLVTPSCPVTHSYHFNLCLNDQAYDCLIHFYKRDQYADLQWKMGWKTTFDGRQPSMEENL